MSLPHTANMDDKEEDKPLAENVGMEHSDDSEDGDDDDDDDDDDVREEELRTKIRLKTKELAKNQYYYDGYINLIDAYKELGDLEELRKIRQRMSEVYPLTPELWLSWLKDEQSIATSKEERAHIVTLFERAVKDYMSVSLWVEYIMFMLGVGDKDATRAVCESALTAVGTHVGEGLLVWQAVLLTEQQVYSSMASTSSEELSEEEIKEQEKQMQKIQSLYKRQVRVPLLNIDGPSLITEMSPWFKGSIERQIKVDLEKAMAKLEDKIPYEDELLRYSSDSNKKLSVYNRYLTLVKETDSPSSVINLYERAITDNALDNRLWEDYIHFLLKQFSTADYLILPACKRSLRNCPWSGPLVEMYINALQKFDQDGEDTQDVSKKINGVVETSFLSCTPMGTDAVRIWMSYLVYLRRNIDWQAQDQKNMEKFRNACFKAIDMIDKTYGEEGDIESEIPRFLARIEAQFSNNIEGARTVWNDIILQRNNNFSNSNLWVEYINLERCYGTEKHCRKLFRRALERIWDWVEVIGYAWKRFEQECGTMETYEDYLKRYNDRLAVVMKVREETAAKEETGYKQNNMKMDKRKQQQKQYKKNQSKTEEFKVPYPANSKKIETGPVVALLGDSWMSRLSPDCLPQYQIWKFCKGGACAVWFSDPDKPKFTNFVSEVVELKPDVAVIHMGGNDIKLDCNVESIVRAIATVYEKLKNSGIAAFISEIPVRTECSRSNLSREEYDKVRMLVNHELYNKLIMEDCNPIINFPSLNESCLMEDGVHLSKYGYCVYIDQLGQFIDSYLDKEKRKGIDQQADKIWNKTYEKKDGGSPERTANSSPPSFINKTVTPNPAYEKKDGGSPEKTANSLPPSFISKTVTPNRGQSEYEIKESQQPMPPPASPGKSAPSPPPGYSGKETSTPPPPGFPGKEVPPPPGFTDKAAPPPLPPPGYPGRTVEPPPGFTDDQSPGRSSKRPAEDDYAGTEHKKRKGDDEEKNSRTVFLKNLSFDVTDEEIHQVFNDCGEIDSLEFVKNFQGRNKGFGYLLFKNIHAAQKALTKDRHPIRGRPVYVNAYEKTNREHYFKFKTGEVEKDKLFIKGLPLSMSEEDVKNVFLQHGPIKDIRLVVYRNGHSKGLCYIDYHDEETAAKVKSAMDGAQLEDMTLHVYYSCPPVKGAPKPMQAALGPRDGAMLPRPTTGVSQRGRLNLLPRALLRNTGATSSKNGSDPASGSSNGSENLEKPKSNEDFRKMLLKN